VRPNVVEQYFVIESDDFLEMTTTLHKRFRLKVTREAQAVMWAQEESDPIVEETALTADLIFRRPSKNGPQKQ